jgi:N-acetylglucosaminyldiphosphoundecaprenol N-acetyl-beta-D-mannosaminyltransferase
MSLVREPNEVQAGRRVTARIGAASRGQPGQGRRSEHSSATPGVEDQEALTHADALSRDVYCVLGVPVDVTEMSTAVQSIRRAADNGSTFLVSTANVNFLVNSQSNPEFRESLIASDLCTADGAPVVLIARLLGVPIRRRIAGSDFLNAIRRSGDAGRELKVFFFGGEDGVAAEAGASVNARAEGVRCVGSMSPGFASVDEMSGRDVIDAINGSGADFLVIALGAAKGQSWLLRNHHRIKVPVRAHLGAALNFEAGTVRRAPRIVQKACLEWLWRIIEEPRLFPRYWNDGVVLLALLSGRVLPLAGWRAWSSLKASLSPRKFEIHATSEPQGLILRIAGPAVRTHCAESAELFRRALSTGRTITVDLAETTDLDARFLGLILMLRKSAAQGGVHVAMRGLSPRLLRLLRLHCAEFLASPTPSPVAAGHPKPVRT